MNPGKDLKKPQRSLDYPFWTTHLVNSTGKSPIRVHSCKKLSIKMWEWHLAGEDGEISFGQRLCRWQLVAHQTVTKHVPWCAECEGYGIYKNDLFTSEIFGTGDLLFLTWSLTQWPMFLWILCSGHFWKSLAPGCGWRMPRGGSLRAQSLSFLAIFFWTEIFPLWQEVSAVSKTGWEKYLFSWANT